MCLFGQWDHSTTWSYSHLLLLLTYIQIYLFTPAVPVKSKWLCHFGQYIHSIHLLTFYYSCHNNNNYYYYTEVEMHAVKTRYPFPIRSRGVVVAVMKCSPSGLHSNSVESGACGLLISRRLPDTSHTSMLPRRLPNPARHRIVHVKSITNKL